MWKKLRLALLILSFLALSSRVAHADNSLSFGLWTHHYSGEAQNEGFENRLIALEIKGWQFAYFDNSYNNDTVFGGYAFHTKKFFSPYGKDWWVRGNAYVGILYGYGDDIATNIEMLGGISPAAYPTGSIGWNNYSVELGVMPTYFWWAFKVEF